MKHPIAIGKLGSAYGVRGWLRVHSHTDPIDNIANYKVLHRKTKAGWQAVAVEGCKRHGKHMIAKLSGIDSPEEAKKHVNTELYIERDDLPTLDDSEEHYWSDLIGCQVTTSDGFELGTVSDMLDTGSNDVFIIEGFDREGASKRHLVPHTEGIILSVDTAAKQIVADWDPEF